jgi:hypothetical protein
LKNSVPIVCKTHTLQKLSFADCKTELQFCKLAKLNLSGVRPRTTDVDVSSNHCILPSPTCIIHTTSSTTPEICVVGRRSSVVGVINAIISHLEKCLRVNRRQMPSPQRRIRLDPQPAAMIYSVWLLVLLFLDKRSNFRLSTHRISGLSSIYSSPPPVINELRTAFWWSLIYWWGSVVESGWCKLQRLRAAPMMKTKLRWNQFLIEWRSLSTRAPVAFSEEHMAVHKRYQASGEVPDIRGDFNTLFFDWEQIQGWPCGIFG